MQSRPNGAIRPREATLSKMERWSRSRPVPLDPGFVCHYLDRYCHGEVMTLGDDGIIVRSLAYSPDGKLIALGGNDDIVRLSDAGTGREVRRIRVHDGPLKNKIKDAAATMMDDYLAASVNGVAFSPDGTRLATASGDGSSGSWDVTNGVLVVRIEAEEYTVFKVAFSHDGTRVMSAGSEGFVRFWDGRSGKLIEERRASNTTSRGALRSARIAPDMQLNPRAGSMSGIHEMVGALPHSRRRAVGSLLNVSPSVRTAGKWLPPWRPVSSNIGSRTNSWSGTLQRVPRAVHHATRRMGRLSDVQP